MRGSRPLLREAYTVQTPFPTGLGGPLAQGAHSATSWACGRSRNSYLVILGASLLFDKFFDASSAIGVWRIWIFTHFHPF